jgi:hypothetical protein
VGGGHSLVRFDLRNVCSKAFQFHSHLQTQNYRLVYQTNIAHVYWHVAKGYVFGPSCDARPDALSTIDSFTADKQHTTTNYNRINIFPQLVNQFFKALHSQLFFFFYKMFSKKKKSKKGGEFLV